MSIELGIRKLNFIREQEMEIFYKEENIGTRRVDFFIEDKIMVELKAIIQLEDVHLAQGLNYLEAYNLETGLLINFGSKACNIKGCLIKSIIQIQVITQSHKSWFRQIDNEKNLLPV